MTSAALAEALAARLCHDVAGPAGTIASLLDMAAEDPEQSAEAMTLARDAATQMLRRIRVTRAAWGGLDAWSEPELPALLTQIASPRLHVSLAPEIAVFRRRLGVDRLLLNVAMLGAEALRGRGQLAFRSIPGGVAALLSATDPATHPSWPPTDGTAMDARRFQSAWTTHAATACGVRLRTSGATLEMTG